MRPGVTLAICVAMTATACASSHEKKIAHAASAQNWEEVARLKAKSEQRKEVRPGCLADSSLARRVRNNSVNFGCASIEYIDTRIDSLRRKHSGR